MQITLKARAKSWLADRRRQDERGFAALLTAMMFVVLFGMAAFAVDVGNWYLTGQQEQRAADAAALAGVPSLPSDQTTAFSVAQKFASANGFKNGTQTVSVVPAIDGQPTRLRVTVTKTVDNVFGGLFGIPKTTITRTAVADYAGPVPLGSPCNEFGNDPESTGKISSNCAGTGQFWANVGSMAAPKVSGDAYQNDSGCSSSVDGCTGSVNNDYDPNGYFYTVTLARPVANLTIDAFDPALIDVGDTCTNNLAGASAITTAHTAAGTNPSVRYVSGSSSPYCTGDIRFGGTGQVTTQFTVRQKVATSNPWDPLSFPVVADATCTQVFTGFSGDLSIALDNSKGGYNPTVASDFRRWKTLCTIPNATAGQYMVQVKTNGLGTDAASGHNRFALRAYSTSDSTAKEAISLAGYNKMAIFANLPSSQTSFFLARVPSGAAGQVLSIGLFDVGDGADGTIQVVPPVGSGVTTFTSCKGTPVAVDATCAFPASSSTNQGKWQYISIPIPNNYTCVDADNTKCWVTLKYTYNSGSQPSDTTSWSANLFGDPVRLVE